MNAKYQARVQASINKAWVDDSTRKSLQSMLSTGSAFWIDTISRIRDPDRDITLESVFRDAAAKPTPPLVVVILYNLPNRDCHASASNGELCCQFDADGTCMYNADDPTCADGLARYKRHYVDPFAAVLEKYSSVPAAVVIEPDSLPNLATNMEDSRCGNSATQTAYVDGITYAIETLHRRAPRAALYLDAGHGGWLGWNDKADDFFRIVGRLGPAVGYLRGFATNTANYQSLGTPCPESSFFDNNWPQLGQQYCSQNPGAACCRDPCRLMTQFNSANNEHNFVQLLAARARRSQINGLLPNPRFIIDTGRNGRDDMRQDCANWCNIRGAAVGHTPTAQTALPNLVDAYYWLKTPGESDGCTETLPNGEHCARYDGSCGSVDSIGSRMGEPRAPEAGAFFASQLAELSCRAGTNSLPTNHTNGGSPPPEADERCPEVVQKATTEAQAEAAASPPEPEAPRYDWRQSTSGDGTARLGAGSFPKDRGSSVTHGVLEVSLEAGDGGNEVQSCPTGGGVASWLVIALLAFASWFFYPRCEPWIRHRLGEERYAYGWTVIDAIAIRVRAAARVVASAIVRARSPGATDFWAGFQRGGSGVAAGLGLGLGLRSSSGGSGVRKPERLPTAAEEREEEFDVLE